RHVDAQLAGGPQQADGLVVGGAEDRRGPVGSGEDLQGDAIGVVPVVRGLEEAALGGYPGFVHGAPPAFDVVGGGVADGGGLGGAAHTGDVLVAVFQEVAYGELGAAQVVGDDGDVVDGLGPLV